MSGLSEDVIRQITERVTREVVAALTHEPDDVITFADEYPDYDEYGGNPISVVADSPPPPEPEPSPIPRHVSPLRARARGHIPEPAVPAGPPIGDATPVAGAVGAVAALGASNATGVRSASGFSPDPFMNPDWFARNYQKDVLNQRRVPPAEDNVTTGRP